MAMPITFPRRLLFLTAGTFASASLLTGCASSEKPKSGEPSSTQKTQVYEEMPTPAQPNATAPEQTTPAASTPSSSAASTAAPGTVVDYTIKQGDSLWLIARNHHTTVAKIRALNNLTSDVIHVGKILKVPAEK
jgi:LysM repeat protein